MKADRAQVVPAKTPFGQLIERSSSLGYCMGKVHLQVSMCAKLAQRVFAKRKIILVKNIFSFLVCD
jgi:hypothetical protein